MMLRKAAELHVFTVILGIVFLCRIVQVCIDIIHCIFGCEVHIQLKFLSRLNKSVSTVTLQRFEAISITTLHKLVYMYW
jgi:hypothetical protein